MKQPPDLAHCVAVSEHNYAETSIIKGIEEFLLCITPLLADDDDRADASSSDEFPSVNL